MISAKDLVKYAFPRMSEREQLILIGCIFTYHNQFEGLSRERMTDIVPQQLEVVDPKKPTVDSFTGHNEAGRSVKSCDKEKAPIIASNESTDPFIWETISEEFEKSIGPMMTSGGYHVQFWSWLKSNYNPPTRK